VLLVETGFAPVKSERGVDIPVFDDDDEHASYASVAGSVALGQWVENALPGSRYDGPTDAVDGWFTIKVPHLESARPAIHRVQLRGTGHDPVASVRVQNLGACAVITYRAEYRTILKNAYVRGTARYASLVGHNFLTDLIASLFIDAVEAADTRSWTLLPNWVQLIRVDLPAGDHDLALDLIDWRGRTIRTVDLPDITIRPGDWTIQSRRYYDLEQ
jgi:hypothetical protein